MNNSYTIGDLVSLYFENEFSAIEDSPLPVFSSKHNKVMKKAFRLFEKNKNKVITGYTMPNTVRNHIGLRKRILITIILIICLALATGAVIAFVSDNFRGTVYNDNTYMFAFDTSGCPTSIEKLYVLSVVPEGYELYELSSSSINQFVIYRNNFNQELCFEQTVKTRFNLHINTEGYTIQEKLINGCDAICVEYQRESGTSSLVIWNSDEYILKLYGNFAKQELIDLANSNEIAGF